MGWEPEGGYSWGHGTTPPSTEKIKSSVNFYNLLFLITQSWKGLLGQEKSARQAASFSSKSQNVSGGIVSPKRLQSTWQLVTPLQAGKNICLDPQTLLDSSLASLSQLSELWLASKIHIIRRKCCDFPPRQILSVWYTLLVSAWEGLSALPSPEGPAWHDTYSTRLVALNFILKQSCCCTATVLQTITPGSIPPAAGLHTQRSAAQELLTNASCIPQGLSGHPPKNDKYPVICSYCIRHDAGSHRSVLVHPK